MLYTGSFELFLSDYMFLFIAGVITVVLAIALRSPVAVGLQILLVTISYFLGGMNAAMQPILIILQSAISIGVIYKYTKAIDMNYQLILEKTHKKDPNLINNEHRGSRFSFWHTN